MTAYLLDTNHLSPLVTISHPLSDRLLKSLQTENTFAIAVPVLAEFLFGIGTLPRAKQNQAVWNILQNRFTYYGIERLDAEHAARLQIALRQRGQQLKTVDAFIAVIALRYNLVLLTSDRDFQAIPGLQQERWL